MKNLNDKIAEILKQHPEGEDFFDTFDAMVRGDLDAGTEDYRMVFSMNGHYYAFEYYYDNYSGWECNSVGKEINEVFPVEKTIIVYE